MGPTIETFPKTLLIGMQQSMTLAENTTAKLWQGFMPRRKEVSNRTTTDFLSMQVYDTATANPAHLFTPTTAFEKWAVVEVSDHTTIPEGMQAYVLQGGLYAVFTHHGPASAFPTTMQGIFGQWLPNSDYELDSREHFEVLPEGYSPIDPDATEKIWIPIKPI